VEEEEREEEEENWKGKKVGQLGTREVGRQVGPHQRQLFFDPFSISSEDEEKDPVVRKEMCCKTVGKDVMVI